MTSSIWYVYQSVHLGNELSRHKLTLRSLSVAAVFAAVSTLAVLAAAGSSNGAGTSCGYDFSSAGCC